MTLLFALVVAVTGPIELADDVRDHDVAAGDSSALATWIDSSEQLRASRFDPATGVTITLTLPAQTHDGIRIAANIAHGSGSAPYVVVWHEPSMFRAARIADDGTLLDTSGFDLTATPAAQIAPVDMALACATTTCLLVWLESGPGSAVKALRFTVDGTTLDPVLTLAAAGTGPQVSALPHLFLAAYGDATATYVSDAVLETSNPTLPTSSPSIIIGTCHSAWCFAWTKSGNADTTIEVDRRPTGLTAVSPFETNPPFLPLAMFENDDAVVIAGTRLGGELAVARFEGTSFDGPDLEDVPTSPASAVHERRFRSLDGSRLLVTEVVASANGPDQLRGWIMTIMGPPLEPDGAVCIFGRNPDGSCAYGNEGPTTAGCTCSSSRPSVGSWPLALVILSMLRVRRRSCRQRRCDACH